jgi:hypothetical protein
MTMANLPLAKDIGDFDFDCTTVNETQCVIIPVAASS